MNVETAEYDILEQYRNISSKLKRRFLRKPNVTEACESFTALAKQCEYLELPSYAGMCWISTARCEGSLGNIPGEASSLVKGARQFLNAEAKDTKLGCPSPSHENLEAAVGCFGYASSRYPEEGLIPISLNLELVDFLSNRDRDGNAEEHLRSAVALSRDNLDTKLYCLQRLASFYIKVNNHSEALHIYNEMAAILLQLPLNGARTDLTLKCEICRIYLLLILRPSPLKLSPDLTELLERYTWANRGDSNLYVCGMPERLFVLTQSLVAACQSSELADLHYLESELSKLLGPEETHLLSLVVKVYLNF